MAGRARAGSGAATGAGGATTVVGATAGVFGRADELAVLDAWAADIKAARGRALVISGEPGIGKSTLLERATALATNRQVRVLSARASEAEQDFPFAALADVLRPLHDLFPSLLPPQRDALEAALGLGPGPAGDPFVISVAALALLAAAAKDAPTAVIVDDAHVLDPASARVLAFVARRIEHDRLGLLAAARRDEPSAFDTDGLDELVVGGLAGADAAQLITDVAHAEVPAPVVARLVAGTGGNPLAMREVAAQLTAAELAGGAPLPDPLTVGPAVQRALARRLAPLDATARRALLVAATATGRSATTAIDAAARLGIPREAFDVHERDGVLVLRD